MEREFDEILETLRVNYKLVIEMHKFLHIQNNSITELTGSMSTLGPSKFSEILGEALEG